MNARLPMLLIAAFVFMAVHGYTEESPRVAQELPTLALVVVENLQRNPSSAITDFHRLDLAFEYVAKQRKWPVTVAAERFAANTPKHETELRVFLQPLDEETSGDLTFRSWVTLTVKEQKHDFGVVTYRYYPRLGENTEDTLEKAFRGAAQAIAVKVEPVLFPQAAAKR
jgi:hypothetical protein